MCRVLGVRDSMMSNVRLSQLKCVCICAPRHNFSCLPPFSPRSLAQQRLFVCADYLWNEAAQDSSSVSSWLPLKPPERVVYFMGLSSAMSTLWLSPGTYCCANAKRGLVKKLVFTCITMNYMWPSTAYFLVLPVATHTFRLANSWSRLSRRLLVAAIWLEYWCAIAARTARPLKPSLALHVATASLIFMRLQLTNLISSQWQRCWCRSCS